MAKDRQLSKLPELTRSVEMASGPITIGIDLGDRFSQCCVLGPNGECLAEGRIRTAPEALAQQFQDLPRARVAIEVGGHSRWVSQLLTAWGHEVLVANARMVQLISAGVRKSDQVDAQLLAQLARIDPSLLAPITHVGHRQYPDIAHLRARALLVRTRTRLVNAVRGIVKTVGIRLPVCHTRGFAEKAASFVPADLQPSLSPLLDIIATLSTQIKAYDQAVERVAHDAYPETARLRQVPGVGPVSALQFVLTIGDPHRFRRSRDVGAFLGLVPRRRQSGVTDKQLRISKAGNSEMRTLLARKLSVLLHRLWISGAAFVPLYNAASALNSA